MLHDTIGCIPWQRPELAPCAGRVLPESFYASLIGAAVVGLPAAIAVDAIGRMVDEAAPDIVLPWSDHSSRAFRRTVAVGSMGQVNRDTVAALYAARRILPRDAENFMPRAALLANWAWGLAVISGLDQGDAEEVSRLHGCLKGVPWGAGHPDVVDDSILDHDGREVATRAFADFAALGPVHASLASLVADIEVPPGLWSNFSTGRHYRRASERVPGLATRLFNRRDPGAGIVTALRTCDRSGAAGRSDEGFA